MMLENDRVTALDAKSIRLQSYIHSEEKQRALYKRTLLIVSISQIFGGAGLAAGVTVGALLAQQMLGTDAFAGIPSALLTFESAGAALFVGRLSQRSGRGIRYHRWRDGYDSYSNCYGRYHDYDTRSNEASWTRGLSAAFAPGDSMVLLVIALSLLGLGWNFGLISGTALIVDSTKTSTRAKTQGTVDVLIALSGAAGGALSGVIVAGSSYSTLSIVGGILSLLLIPVVVWSRGGKNKNKQ
jgi:MFS family permease